MVDFGATQLLLTLSTLALSIAVATTTAVAYALFRHRLSGQQFDRASNANGVSSVSGLKPSATTMADEKGIAVHHQGSVPVNANTATLPTAMVREETEEELKTATSASESSGSNVAVCSAFAMAEPKNSDEAAKRTTTIDNVHDSQMVRMKQSSFLTCTTISKVDEVDEDFLNDAPTARDGDVMEQMVMVAGCKGIIDEKLFILQPARTYAGSSAARTIEMALETRECSATTDGPLSEIAHNMSSGDVVFGNENTPQLLGSSLAANDNGNNRTIQNVGTRCTIVSRELAQLTGSDGTAVPSKAVRNGNNDNESATEQLAHAWTTALCATVHTAHWTIDAGDTAKVAKVEEKVSSCRNASVDRNLAQLSGERHVRANDVIDLEQVIACDSGCNSATAVCNIEDAWGSNNNVDDPANESNATASTSGEGRAQVEFRSSVQAVQVVTMAKLSHAANSVDDQATYNPASHTVSSQAAVVEDAVDTRQSLVVGRDAAEMLCSCSTAEVVDGNYELVVQALERANNSQLDTTKAHDEAVAAKAAQKVNCDNDASSDIADSSAMDDTSNAVACVTSERAAVASTDDVAQQVQIASSDREEDVSSSINGINVGVCFEPSSTTTATAAAGQLGKKCEAVDTESIAKEVAGIAVGCNVGADFGKKSLVATESEVADDARTRESNSAPTGDGPQMVRQDNASVICEVAQMMPDHDGSSLGQVASQVSSNNADLASEVPPEAAAAAADSRPSDAGKNVDSSDAYGGAIVYYISEPEYSNNSDVASFCSE